MTKKVLIISYTFPPFPGIGGRRWAKFAKYLKQNGYSVKVICCENPFKDRTSEWMDDVAGIEQFQLKRKYPRSLITYPGGLSGKISYHLGLRVVKLFAKGNYFDRTVFWEKQLIKKASELIAKDRIKNVIATGGPFQILAHSCKLKEHFPDLNLVVDFRDYWTKDTSLSAMKTISPERVAEEKKMEKYVCEKADKIITVSAEMNKYFTNLSNKENVTTIPNGYDPDDFKNLEGKKYADSKKINIVFTGNLYHNLGDIFYSFCDALKKIKSENRPLYDTLNFEFYGNPDAKMFEHAKKEGLDIIHYFGLVSLRESLNRVKSSQYCMLFLNDVYSFSLSTKFCEYIGLRKKILLFSRQGFASDFIEENKLGFWIDPENAYQKLMKILLNRDNERVNNPNFDFEQFSVGSITNKLIPLLQ